MSFSQFEIYLIFWLYQISRSYICPDGYCIKFDTHYFMLNLFLAINDCIFELIMLIERGILLKNYGS